MRCNLKSLSLILLAAAILLYGRPVFTQDETEEEAPEAEAEAPEEGEEETEEAEAEGEEEAPEAAEATEEETPDTAETAAEEEAEEPEAVEEAPEEEALEAEEAAAVEAGVAAEGAVEAEEAASSVTLEAEAKPAKKSAFRSSYFLYENTFSAYTLKKDAQLTYDPYYAMSYSFRPRYYIWKDLSVRLRWDLEQELTDADDTTKKRQVIWSDVLIDLVWANAYTIPAIDVILGAKIRIELPASLASQARTQYLSLGPGFDLVKIFDVWGGITLWYAFRYTKYFNQYTSTLSEAPVLECPDEGPCVYDVMGPQNPSHRFTNDFILEIRPIPEFYFSATLEVRNYLLYKVPDAEVETMGGTVTLESSGKRHIGYMWYIFEFGYDILPYFTVAIGTNTYNPMLNPESEYYPPFFNRFTNFYLDFAVDLDGMINSIVKGKAKKKSAKDRL